MGSKRTNMNPIRLSSEMEPPLRLADMDVSQQFKMRERQRFFEEVFQHDVDVYFSSAHLQIDNRRPPMGSISSMEVNVDMLEQMELLDISDPEALDVFLGTSEDDDAVMPPLAVGCISDGDDGDEDTSLRLLDSSEVKTRMSSTSSNCTSDSQTSDEGGAETPVNQSDDEDVHGDDNKSADRLSITGTREDECALTS